MPFITNKAVVIIDGVEYPNNDLSVNDAGHRLMVGLDRALDHVKFDRVNPYNGVLDKENGVFEYDCTATQTNGHIMKFKIRFPSANVKIEHCECQRCTLCGCKDITMTGELRTAIESDEAIMNIWPFKPECIIPFVVA